jgi:hypothetical protein
MPCPAFILPRQFPGTSARTRNPPRFQRRYQPDKWSGIQARRHGRPLARRFADVI